MAVVVPDELVELALRPSGRPGAGLLIDRTPERLLTLQPNFPIPGPNSVSRIRCAPDRVASVVAEVRRRTAQHGLNCMWILDPDVAPADLPERLATCGITLEDEVAAMVLPATAVVAMPDEHVELVDALGDATTFQAAEAVQVAAFGANLAPRQDGRFADARADPRRRFLLAVLDGEPAGAGWATVYEDGVFMNGGAVAPRFRSRGVYRALVAERLDLARRAGAPGLAVQARLDTAAPILARLGFTEVGRVRMFAESKT